MAEAVNASDEWELCKENVQPLRHGRSFTEMSAAIQPSNAARIKQEQEYVLCTSDDSICRKYRYIVSYCRKEYRIFRYIAVLKNITIYRDIFHNVVIFYRFFTTQRDWKERL